MASSDESPRRIKTDDRSDVPLFCEQVRIFDVARPGGVGVNGTDIETILPRIDGYRRRSTGKEQVISSLTKPDKYAMLTISTRLSSLFEYITLMCCFPHEL